MAQKEITIEYARQILGDIGKKMTDEEVGNLLNTLRLLCGKMIDSTVEKNYESTDLL